VHTAGGPIPWDVPWQGTDLRGDGAGDSPHGLTALWRLWRPQAKGSRQVSRVDASCVSGPGDTTTRASQTGPGEKTRKLIVGGYIPGSIIGLTKAPKTEPMKSRTTRINPMVYNAVSSRIPNIRFSPFPEQIPLHGILYRISA
jgi:hypothetical protein